VRNIFISAVAVLVLGAASAQAGTEKEVIVNYGDLDVATADGAQILYKRVQIASAEVCGYKPAISDISEMKAFKTCSDAAEARAVKTLPFDLSARIENKAEVVAAR
jgi:UrcA family protein